MKQLSFLPKLAFEHGGDIRKGRRKLARPVDPRRPLHVVMRSARARGELSMLAPRNKRRVERSLAEIARKRGIRVYRVANVGNHLHLLLKTPDRRALSAFLRELAGRIAMLITGAAKGRAQKFWYGLAYSRIVSWGRDFKGVHLYLIQNLFEATGVLTQKMKARGVRARWAGG